MTIGQRIKKLRTDAGLSQEKLGEMIDVSYQTVCYIEKGRRIPRVPVVLAIAELFTVSTDYIIWGRD